jgi:predicted 3-demethylubiquinone-9 3-methyltransferase (glyoxalase superfamily)
MSPVEAVEQALPLVGNATAEELAAFVKDRYGVTLQVRFVPIIREMLKDKERRAASLRARPSFEPGSDAAAEAS